MKLIYYTGTRWVFQPHHLLPNFTDWIRLLLIHPLSRVEVPTFTTDRGLGYVLRSIHEANNMGIFDTAFNNGESGKPDQAFTDPDFGLKHPTLHAFLTSVVDDAGKKRLTSTVLIFCEEGHAKAVLRERNHDLSLWVTAKSILEAFEELEEALQNRPIEWRKNKEQRGGWKK